MTAIQITCQPPDAIHTIDPDVIGALDLLAITLGPHPHWRILIQLPGALLHAHPTNPDTTEEAA